MKRFTQNLLRSVLALCIVLLMIVSVFTLAPRSKLADRMTAFAQSIGYRFGPTGYIGIGTFSSACFEPSYNQGPDTCLTRVGPGVLSIGSGSLFQDAGYINSLSTAIGTSQTGSTGTIPSATYRASGTYVTAVGGQTTIVAAGEATQAITLGQNLVLTAPAQQYGAVGWLPYVSTGGGATLTEVSQPVITAGGTFVCTGAFQVSSAYGTTGNGQFQPTSGNPPAAPGGSTSLYVCPFGANATFTSLVTSATSIPVTFSNGQTANIAYGQPVPGQNNAAIVLPTTDPVGVISTQPALASVTTAQTVFSIPINAGFQNTVGKTLRVCGQAVYTSSAGSGAPVIALTEGGITPITVTGITQTGTTAASQIEFCYDLQTISAGASGTLEAHGYIMNGPGASLGESKTLTLDQNSAASSAINLTAANTLAIVISDATSLTSFTLRGGSIIALN